MLLLPSVGRGVVRKPVKEAKREVEADPAVEDIKECSRRVMRKLKFS